MRKFFFIFGLALFFIVGVESVKAIGGSYSNLTLPRIMYQGGNDNPRPEALRSLLAQISRRTSIEVNREPVALKISDPELFRYPFLTMAGDAGFDPFPEKDLKILRNYLSYGGFLFIDDNSARADSDRKLSTSCFVTVLSGAYALA